MDDAIDHVSHVVTDEMLQDRTSQPIVPGLGLAGSPAEDLGPGVGSLSATRRELTPWSG